MPKTLTAGQIFARDMRKNLGIGTRTRIRRNGRNLHEVILECIENASQVDGYYTEQRQEIFRTATGAYRSYDTHITSPRFDGNFIAHIKGLSPWQLCNLLGDMVDAGVTSTGQGERYFRQLRSDRYAQAA
jgi:hypothetical protein